MEFSRKPEALIAASAMRVLAHQSLTGTLLMFGADMPEASRMLIPLVKAKVKDGEIVDAPTMEGLKGAMKSARNDREADKLSLWKKW